VVTCDRVSQLRFAKPEKGFFDHSFFTLYYDAFVKSKERAFRSWFDTCLTDGRQASPRTENRYLYALQAFALRYRVNAT
jgi:hypothetical protein